MEQNDLPPHPVAIQHITAPPHPLKRKDGGPEPAVRVGADTIENGVPLGTDWLDMRLSHPGPRRLHCAPNCCLSSPGTLLLLERRQPFGYAPLPLEHLERPRQMFFSALLVRGPMQIIASVFDKIFWKIS